MWGPDLIVAGVDLTASPGRRSWIAVLGEGEISTAAAAGLIDIVNVLVSSETELVVVDAPLSLPPPGEAWRDEEREMLSSGLRPLPLNLRSMRLLGMRGIALSSLLEEEGIRALETHPSSARKMLGVGPDEISGALGGEANEDEVDALTAALVGVLAAMGRARLWGRKMILPSPEDGNLVLKLLDEIAGGERTNFYR